MICGKISLGDHYPTPDNIVNEIAGEMSWDSCISGNVESEAFSGVFLHSKSLCFSAKDFFYNEKDPNVLVFWDGFIYNREDLLEKLSIKNSDIDLSEIILKAYLYFGESFADQLNGDFAICIYLKSSREVLFYRDHMGIRPLAICRIGSEIYFSTDKIGICKTLFGNEKVNPDYLLNFFHVEGKDYSILPDQRVKLVRPGHYIKIDASKMIQYKYWHPERIRSDNRLKLQSVIREIDSLLTDAVNIRCDSRFKASAHVSGGLDSGVVAALSRRQYPGQTEFFGFSWSPNYLVDSSLIKYDERVLVKRICEENMIIPVHADLSTKNYFNSLSDWRYPDSPMFERNIVEKASSLGVQLIFSGWGGDEFISFGNGGIDADLIRKFHFITFLRKYQGTNPRRVLSALVFNAIFPSRNRDYLKLRTEPFIFKFIKNNAGNNLIPRAKRISFTSRRRMHLQLINKNHLSARCGDWYVLGQRHGIEYRYPLLDKRIVEYILTVPSKCLVDGSHQRTLLRKIGKEVLPEDVISNITKTDHVQSFFWGKALAETEPMLIEELAVMKSNKELNFIDYNLLDTTLAQRRREEDKAEEENLAYLLSYIKRAHEFTCGYHA